MIENIHPIRFVLPVSVALALFTFSIVQADQNPVGHPRLIEVFTTAKEPVKSKVAISQQWGYRKMELQVYELDGIQRTEAQLTKGLTADPKQAKRVVVQRIQELDEHVTSAIQNAAVGLAKAMQYGIDRYPAIVFDGAVVVYGLTDLIAAADHYQTWQTETQP
ncbi:MAG: TIGR03757 family integrating conjugative element protein [Candidatus Thiodiazotropha lotti]|nr:TIGR03757 family integrating conjugative element protein [Candidatus Thiodiazotropha lotti]